MELAKIVKAMEAGAKKAKEEALQPEERALQIKMLMGNFESIQEELRNDLLVVKKLTDADFKSLVRLLKVKLVQSKFISLNLICLISHLITFAQPDDNSGEKFIAS